MRKIKQIAVALCLMLATTAVNAQSADTQAPSIDETDAIGQSYQDGVTLWTDVALTTNSPFSWDMLWTAIRVIDKSDCYRVFIDDKFPFTHVVNVCALRKADK